LAFPIDHPVHHSLIGSMADLDAASLDDIAHFFQTYYTPDNAVLTIAGDFDAGEAREMVARHFGPIPRGAGKPLLADMTVPPTFGGPLREVVADDVVLPRLFLAFRSPVFGSDTYYAASVAGAILGMRRGSRLHRALVREQQVAAEAQAFTYDLSKGSDLLVVDVTARQETSVDRLEQAVHAEIDSMYRNGVTDAEVARAVTLIETELVAALQSAGERADRLSMFATYFGDPELLNRQASCYRAVTTAQVNAVIRERFGRDNRASLLFVPRDADTEPTQSDLAMAEVP
jgi:predicted Zn-dependent peptidase